MASHATHAPIFIGCGDTTAFFIQRAENIIFTKNCSSDIVIAGFRMWVPPQVESRLLRGAAYVSCRDILSLLPKHIQQHSTVVRD
jgi:hypothetical protein